MTEPDPKLPKDFSRIERGLSNLYRPIVINPEFSARLEKKLVENHKMKTHSLSGRFTALRGHAASFGWMLFFAALLVVVILVIDSLPRTSSVHPAGPVSGGPITPNSTPISTLTPTIQEPATALPAIIPTRGNPSPRGSTDRLRSSPDGRWTAVFNPQIGGFEVQKTGGATQTLLPKETDVYDASWSPDSSMLAVSLSQPVADPAQPRFTEIWLSRVDGDTLGELKPFYTPGNSSDPQFSGGLQIDLGAWSPDSSRLLFWQGMMSASAGMDGLPLWVLNAKTGGEKQVAAQTLLNPGYQSWAPDSRAMVFSNGGDRSAQVKKWLSLYQVDTGQISDLISSTQLVPGLVAWAPDGNEIAFAAVEAAKTGMDLADYMGWNNPAILARRIYLYDIKTNAYRRLDQTEAYQDAPRWAGNNLLFVQMSQNQASLMDANLETGITTPLSGCQSPLPADAGTYGQTDWHELYDSCRGQTQNLGGNPVIVAFTATPATTPPVLPAGEIHRSLASGLRIEEYALLGPPNLDPLTFTPLQGSQPNIFFLPSTPLNTQANLTYDSASHQVRSVILGNDRISATEINTTSSTASNGDVFQVASIQVTRNGQVIQAIPAGDLSPLDTLRGLWAIGDNTWVLEIAHVTNTPGANNSISSDAVGQIFQDGMLLNEGNNYQAAFGFQTMNGRPFYFFKRDGLINIVFDGQEIPLGYTDVPHYGCCSGAEMNPKSYVDGVTFFAQRGGRWYYVGIGIDKTK